MRAVEVGGPEPECGLPAETLEAIYRMLAIAKRDALFNIPNEESAVRVARIVAELLSYPDAAWREKRAGLGAAIQTVDDESMAAVLSAFVERAFSCDAHEFEGRYVDASDFSEETNLNLTSQSCKDERQQRMTLLGYSLYFENAGFTPGKRACRRAAKLPEGDAPGSRGFTFGAARATRGTGQPKDDGSEGRERHPRLNLRRGLPEMPPNAPRETDFAAEQPEGDGFGADFVTLGGSHGARTRQMARGAPRGTADAVNQPKGGDGAGGRTIPRLSARKHL